MRLFGALLCIALIVADRRRDDLPTLSAPRFVDRRIPLADGNPFALRSPAVVVTAAATVAGVLIVSPAWGLLCGLVAAVCGFGLRRVRVVAVAGVALLGVVALVMIRRFLDLKPFVNAGWPGYFEDLHRPAMAAIVLLAVDLVVAERRHDRHRDAPASDSGQAESASGPSGGAPDVSH